MTRSLIARFNAAILLLAALLISMPGFAEAQKTINTNINRDDGGASFLSSPWVWIVGAGVFVLLLAALLNGGRKSDD